MPNPSAPNPSVPCPSPLEVAQADAESIAEASAVAQEHARSIAEASQVAHDHARSIAATLMVSEIRYRRLFETARDGILILDSETDRITDANPFIAELLGYSQDEFLGKELWEIGPLRDKESSQEAFRLLQREGEIRYDNLPLETRRGERREVKFLSSLYREDEHTVIQCNIRDITERKALEQALAAVAARNEHIAETLQHGMLQDAPEGKFPGLVVKTLYEAALDESKVGGDFFDTFALSRDRVALVVGDVSGKGLVAAVRTVEVKYALRALLHAYEAPGLALTYLNSFIYEPAMDDALVEGDFFDAFSLPDKSILFAVGDVTGKGLKAAARPARRRRCFLALLLPLACNLRRRRKRRFSTSRQCFLPWNRLSEVTVGRHTPRSTPRAVLLSENSTSSQ